MRPYRWGFAVALVWLGVTVGRGTGQNPQPLLTPEVGGVASSSPVEDGFRPGALRDHWLIEAEYLLWWSRAGTIPNGGFVGATSVADFAGSNGGLENLTPLTNSNQAFDFGGQSGVRLKALGYFDADQGFGLDASWFQVFNGSGETTYYSGSDTILGPVFTDLDGTRTLVIAALPASASVDGMRGRAADVRVGINSDLWGVDMNARMRLPTVFFSDRIYLLAGLRYVQYEESFNVRTTSYRLPDNIGPDVVLLSDSFSAKNQFFGPQIGVQSRTQFGRFSLDLGAKGAVGGMAEEVAIRGETVIGANGSAQRTVGGVLAQRSNIGGYDSVRTAWLGEFTVRGGYNLSENLRATVGYNLLTLSGIVRAGDAVDLVDSRGVPILNDPVDPNATRPGAPTLAESRWWVQGVTFGLDLSF